MAAFRRRYSGSLSPLQALHLSRNASSPGRSIAVDAPGTVRVQRLLSVDERFNWPLGKLSDRCGAEIGLFAGHVSGTIATFFQTAGPGPAFFNKRPSSTMAIDA